MSSVCPAVCKTWRRMGLCSGLICRGAQCPRDKSHSHTHTHTPQAEQRGASHFPRKYPKCKLIFKWARYGQKKKKKPQLKNMCILYSQLKCFHVYYRSFIQKHIRLGVNLPCSNLTENTCIRQDPTKPTWQHTTETQNPKTVPVRGECLVHATRLFPPTPPWSLFVPPRIS